MKVKFLTTFWIILRFLPVIIRQHIKVLRVEHYELRSVAFTYFLDLGKAIARCFAVITQKLVTWFYLLKISSSVQGSCQSRQGWTTSCIFKQDIWLRYLRKKIWWNFTAFLLEENQIKIIGIWKSWFKNLKKFQFYD